jgi:hypothetical protein
VSSAASSTGSWQPNVQPGSILTTPPNRPYETSASRAGSRGAKLLAALVIVPVMFGFFSNGSHEDPGMGDGTVIEMPMGDGGPMAPRVRLDSNVDPSSIDNTLLEGQPTVLDVPAYAKSLRVEIVGDPDTNIEVDTSVSGVPARTESVVIPFAENVYLDELPTSLEVTVRDSTSGSGTLQCRVYADDVLVALDTGTSDVTCSPRMR